MTRIFLRYLALVILVAIGAGPALAADDKLPPLPPLEQPAHDTRLPGKFIWADLFTSEFDAALKFYAETFGWEWRWVSQHPKHRYAMFYSDGHAVAGVAHYVPSETKEAYGRWVHYVSVEDVAKAVTGAEAEGGRVLMGRRSAPDRGDFAIVADAEGAPFGVLRSSSGDPPDYRAQFGEWLWVGLFARDADTASKFYASLFGYEVFDFEGTEENADVLEFVLAAGGHSRAGVGQLSADSESKPTWLGSVRVEDVATTLKRARSAGGEVVYESDPEEMESHLSVIADPFGATVGVMQWTFEDAEPSGAEAAQ
jgi:predicted enzyme related to lactoylglutathione lyase